MSAIDLIFRPIDQWPGEFTVNRPASPFGSDWAATIELLEREVRTLQNRRRAKGIVLQLAVPEGAIRQDGQLVAGRRPPEHPGVIVSFETPAGPLRFSCDRYDRRWGKKDDDGWRQNVRAIALGLEALRKVERYGLGSGREQYVGFQALPPATPMGAALTVEGALRFLAEHAYGDPDTAIVDVDVAYRLAAKRLHPDAGGDPAAFRRLTEARDLVEASR